MNDSSPAATAVATAADPVASEERLSALNLAVMANRMDAICREMTNTVLHSARSAVIGIARDFSCAIITSDHEVLATAEAMPIHVFGMNIQTTIMSERHPDYREGDAFLDNDPYGGNSHAADHTILVPVFHEGEHFFTVGVKAHQADVGNSQPTTYFAAAKDVYHEGALIFPCVQVQRDYRDIDDIVRMCRRRIRVPDQWFGDYLAAIGAARIGERRLKAFIEKYGAEAVRAFIGEWLDYSERRARESIRALPSGRLVNEGCHDPIQPFLPDGIPVKVTIDIDADAGFITVDLRDNPDCVDAGMNLTRVTSTMAAAQAVFACLDPDIPHNAGSFRRLDVLLRENCVVGIPRFPHSCSVATTNMTDMIINLIQSAFATLGDGYGFSQGNFCNGAGTGVCSGKDWRRDGAPYVNQMFMSAGGMPASARNDGMHGLVNPVSVGLVYRDSNRGERAALPVSGGQRPRAGGFMRRRAAGAAGRRRRSSSAPATIPCWSSTSATGSPSCRRGCAAACPRTPAIRPGSRPTAAVRSTRPTPTATWNRAPSCTPSTTAGAATATRWSASPRASSTT